MHYRNGREAKNGDKVVQLGTQYDGAKDEHGASVPKLAIIGVGILFNATPGNDYCNGLIAPLLGGPVVGACMCDCLHYDDVVALFVQAGLDKRPPGK